ncbi:aldehyde reductase ii [Ophiocordyceps camponoti-floridani]|uniref:Aldehyde reductase ii n=1 Tax=Ophiocordyceps camponoti-floridani TaxID=2030778 RepID=A0A8H4Q8M5_9HYPO|nr:aldehyde reductase ii [Ophiocordyceps camponoti-floridani]
MAPVPDGSLILVTGVNGYLGSHIAKELLHQGFRVRGTVREAYKAEYMHGLFDEKYGSDAFTTCIVEDMATTGAFDDVVKGCSGIIHVASDVCGITDPNKVIPVAAAGVQNALAAAARETSVKRFVLTSSSAACSFPCPDNGAPIDVTSWSDPRDDVVWAPPPYHEDRLMPVYIASKVTTEKSCWRFMEENKPSFTFNAVLPPWVLGTILSEQQPASSAGVFRKLWQGDEDAAVFLKNALVEFYINITDVAVLHAAALREVDVEGERLLAFGGKIDIDDTIRVFLRLRDGGDGFAEFDTTSKGYVNKTVVTERCRELLRRYGRPGFTSEAGLRA